MVLKAQRNQKVKKGSWSTPLIAIDEKSQCVVFVPNHLPFSTPRIRERGKPPQTFP